MKMTISNTPISLSTMNKMLNLLKLYIFRCTVLYIASAFKKIPKVVTAVMFVYYSQYKEIWRQNTDVQIRSFIH